MSVDDAPHVDERVASAPTRWVLQPTVAFAIVAGTFLAALALLTHRPLFALVALPVFGTVALGARRRTLPEELRSGLALGLPDAGAGVSYRLRVDVPSSVEAVALSVVTADDRRHRVVVDRRSAERLAGTVPVTHSGPQEIARVHVSAMADGGLHVSPPTAGPTAGTVVPPPHLRLEDLPIPLRVLGITGAHDSTTPGEGGAFRDVALFTPGDRLRRIDWRRTARRAQHPGELYVRRTLATADALVVIVLDDRDDLAADVTEWSGTHRASGGSRSLDLGRECATSLATAYIGAGDRVGFRSLSGAARSVEPRGGTRQLDRLRSTIATAAARGDVTERVREPLVPTASLVVVASTFVDDAASTMAVSWAGRGHRVVAVDVLPRTDLSTANRQDRAAFQLVALEREERLATMRAAGVDVIRWDAPHAGGPAVALRLLSRPRRTR
ncbi:DUF58 domain-containing protein [Curtobacterium sp. Leaf261]|uniref:DUF58 domain-containing protein n=1 Tax=Curtobacterium sp. Leaf261 TaxID=1736311 RepID=UPI0006F4A44F|nr:DUF58 domain-containing protein [Curtobacterium sp. Leaf261]KQO64876.1 hypothetical protein ASF23_01465 [Curtobacterium sp. Leaf261]